MSVLIVTEFPTFYTSSERLNDEIPHQDDRYILLAAHHDVVDLIISSNVSCVVAPSNHEVIMLPFTCDQYIQVDDPE